MPPKERALMMRRTFEVWHRLPGAPFLNRIKGCSQESHLDSVRVAGCPPASCSPLSWCGRERLRARPIRSQPITIKINITEKNNQWYHFNGLLKVCFNTNVSKAIKQSVPTRRKACQRRKRIVHGSPAIVRTRSPDAGVVRRMYAHIPIIANATPQ